MGGVWGPLFLLIALDASDTGQWQPLRPTRAPAGRAAESPEIPPLATQAETAATEDWLLETRAREALWKEARLTDLSLEVTVRSGVASVFGAAPSQELRQRAAVVVEAVEGIRSVRNQVRVRTPASPPEPGPRVFPPVDQPPRSNLIERPLPADRGPVSPGILTGRPQPDQSADDSRAWQPKPAGDITAKATLGSSPLAFSLPRLLQANPRFRGVEFSLNGDRVRLRGTLATEADLADLVRAVSSLDGVEAISTDEVVVTPRP